MGGYEGIVCACVCRKIIWGWGGGGLHLVVCVGMHVCVFLRHGIFIWDYRGEREREMLTVSSFSSCHANGWAALCAVPPPHFHS